MLQRYTSQRSFYASLPLNTHGIRILHHLHKYRGYTLVCRSDGDAIQLNDSVSQGLDVVQGKSVPASPN